jgi:hypothetical protein
MINGIELSVPRTVVAVVTRETSTSMRGRRIQRSNAARFSRKVHSSFAPPTTYPNAPGSRRSSAARS